MPYAPVQRLRHRYVKHTSTMTFKLTRDDAGHVLELTISKREVPAAPKKRQAPRPPISNTACKQLDFDTVMSPRAWDVPHPEQQNRTVFPIVPVESDVDE